MQMTSLFREKRRGKKKKCLGQVEVGQDVPLTGAGQVSLGYCFVFDFVTQLFE